MSTQSSWVKRHLRLLEVKGEFSARTALFEEFYLDTCTFGCTLLS